MDKRDRIIAKLALALDLVDEARLRRALQRAPHFPEYSFDRLLLASGLIDVDGHRRLVEAFNEQLGRARERARPARKADLARRGLSGSDVIPLERPAREAPAEDAPGDDAVFDEPTLVVEESSEDLLVPSSEDVFDQPTLVVADEAPGLGLQPPSDEGAALEDEGSSAELAVPDDALFDQPTTVLDDDAPLELLPPTPTARDQTDPLGTALLAGVDPLDLPIEPPTAPAGPGSGGSLDEDLDLRLQRDVDPHDPRSRRLPPGSATSGGGENGPLTRREFKRRLKQRLGFEGFTLGDYRVLGEIARGAFGVVLEVEAGGVTRSLAQDRGYEGRLALKVALENTSDPRETERFLDETRIQIGFTHPHIVRIFDCGVESGLTYYSMELIRGVETRSHVRDNGPMPPLLAVRVVKEIASALAYVHAQRIYHRDLKPQNVLLDQDRQPYRAVLIDFGLVTQHSSEKDKGLILGTPSYMPPEQAQPRGGHGSINATSDVYALGATLFFLLTGKPPFAGADPRQVIKQVVGEPPPDPVSLNPQVPRRIADVCLKCLAKRQRDRYHSAKQLEADLDKELRAGQLKIKAKALFGKLLGKDKS